MDQQQLQLYTQARYWIKVAIGDKSPSIRRLAWATAATLTVVLYYCDRELMHEHLGEV